MACRNAYNIKSTDMAAHAATHVVTAPVVEPNVDQLLFGVNSKTQANDLLQNNLEEFEWVLRNKIYPNFYGRYLNGENALTKEEAIFLHRKGCKIAAIYTDSGTKQTEEQGALLAKKAEERALDLNIPRGTAIFLEIDENTPVTRDFMRGFAAALILAGYTPGFKANTDARFDFDREFSRGVQSNKELFKACLIWAVAPTVKEYDGMTTSHLIHPDNWKPFAPSCMTRNEIAIWQYGKDCHPIENDRGNPTAFNLDLVRNKSIILDKMF